MIKKNYIPTIDISFILKYGLENKKSKKILQKIEHACTKVGFFQIVGHNIRQSDIKKITKKSIPILMFRVYPYVLVLSI